MPLYYFVLLPILTSLLAYLTTPFFKTLSKYFNVSENRIYTFIKAALLLLQFFYLVMASLNFYKVRIGNTIYETFSNYPMGIGITLKADVLSSIMVCLTIFLFTNFIIFNFRKTYMNKLFFFLFLTLEGLLCGTFFSNDLFNIYVLIEVSTTLVSILIIYKKTSEAIYNSMIYFLTNLASMTMFFLGIGYMYKIFGTLDLSLLLERMSLITDPKTLIIPYALLITGVSLKTAVLPLFSWLPKAHGVPSAPSVISAMLSGLYIKAGVYLFIRITDLFSPVINTSQLFLVLGFLTAVIGVIFALSQKDLKLILAYSTVSQLGFIIFGLSIGNNYSYWGSIYHILNHAIFKSVLFLTAGMIIDEYETRNINQINSVFKRMPFVSIASIMAILGITGVPFFNGFFSKYFIMKGSGLSLPYEIAFFIINLGTIMCFVKYSRIFFGKTTRKFKIKFNQAFVILCLGITCLLGGLLGSFFLNILFDLNVKIDSKSIMNKFEIYIISLIIGILFYNFAYRKIKLFNSIRALEISYNKIVINIMVFFCLILTYLFISL